MKKYIAIALTLVLTASLLAGCRNRNQPMETTMPTVMPTTKPTTAPTTEATLPATEETRPSETVDHGNGPLDTTGNTAETDATAGGKSTEATTEGRSARPMPKN